MPKAMRCKLGRRLIDIHEALRLREDRRRGSRYPAFECVECGQPVRPHREGSTGQAAHFEHRERTKGCSLSS
jgi:hypothetical protein